jgi:hypothetical protein
VFRNHHAKSISVLQLSWTVVWNLANQLILCLKCRSTNLGASVAFELLTWLALAGSVGYMLGCESTFYSKWTEEGDVGPREWQLAGSVLGLIVL